MRCRVDQIRLNLQKYIKQRMTSGEKLALYLRVVKDLTGIGGDGMNEVQVHSSVWFASCSEPGCLPV